MLIELAGLLVGSGLFLLIIGVFVARQYTLRSKLLTVFLVIVLMSLAVLAFLDSFIMSDALMRGAEKELLSSARNYAERIDDVNRFNTQSIEKEASLPAINYFLTRKARPPFHRQAILEILRVLKSRQNAHVFSYAILNTDGINLLDTNIENIGKDESDEAYYSSVLIEDKAYRSTVVFEKERPTITFSSAIRDLSGQLIGVLRAKYHADILSAPFESVQSLAGSGSFVMLLDENKLRLVDSRRKNLVYSLSVPMSENRRLQLQHENLLPKNISNLQSESDAWYEKIKSISLESPIFESSYKGLGTKKFLSAVYALETQPWSIVVSQPLSAILEPVEEQKNSAFILVSIIALIVVLVVLATTQLLLGPVKRLTSVVKNIAEGDLAVKATVEADDEIGRLASAFNEMTQSVTNLIVDLEDEVDNHKLTADSLRKLSQAIEQSPVSVMITSLEGVIEYVNPQLCKITGYQSEELIGRQASVFNSGKVPDVQYKNLWDTIKAGRSWTGELYNKKKNGDLFWESVTISPIKNAMHESTHYLAIREDISLRKDYEGRLLHQARYDVLTDLPNRSLAYERIQNAISDARQKQEHVAIIYMDFDHFKNINDTLGHAAGDEFLIYMSNRLTSCVRERDTVARLGGDEFLIMFVEEKSDLTDNVIDENYSFTHLVEEKTREILKHVSRSCTIQEMEFAVTASAGIAMFPEHGNDPQMLLRNADTAMYRSKRKGRNTYQMFTMEMSDVVMKRVEIDNKLHSALDANDFYLKYQVLMDAQTQRIVGVEALIRWEDPVLGEISPEEFVPLAEESGLIVEIGSWVLDTVCADIKQWRELDGLDDLYVAVNLSTRQFRGKDIVQDIAQLLEKYDLQGDCLELEITERLLMKDVPDVVSILEQFKAMGIRLSIDDFGTGYSSLSYLKRFPFDVLKIDKAFVDDIGVNLDGQALCDAIILMAHSLDLSLIAEGVETLEQFEFLRERGVETIQGYYVSKPILSDEFIVLLNASEGFELKLSAGK